MSDSFHDLRNCCMSPFKVRFLCEYSRLIYRSNNCDYWGPPTLTPFTGGILNLSIPIGLFEGLLTILSVLDLTKSIFASFKSLFRLKLVRCCMAYLPEEWREWRDMLEYWESPSKELSSFMASIFRNLSRSSFLPLRTVQSLSGDLLPDLFFLDRFWCSLASAFASFISC